MINNYENMGIYDLRNYARTLGVARPTTFKRAELIEKIEEIINGKKPDENITKKGRPPKHSKDEDSVFEMVLPDNLFSNNDDVNYKTYQSAQFPKLSGILSENNHVSQNNILFEGYYRDYSNEFGLACLKGCLTNYYKENTVVTRNLSNSYNLKSGDYIEGNAKFLPEKQLMLATEILYVNGVESSKLEDRQNFEDIIPCYPTKKIQLGKDFDEVYEKNPFAKGQRIVCNFKNKSKKIDCVKSVLKSFSETNEIRTLLVTIDDALEDIGSVLVECKDVEVCKMSAFQTRSQYFERFATLLSNCAKRLEFAQDVAIVFYNEKSFLDAYANEIFTSQSSQQTSLEYSKVIAIDKLKDCFNLARNTDCGSLTVLVFDDEEILSEIANCKVEFDEEYKLNKSKSFVKNFDKIS